MSVWLTADPDTQSLQNSAVHHDRSKKKKKEIYQGERKCFFFFPPPSRWVLAEKLKTRGAAEINGTAIKPSVSFRSFECKRSPCCSSAEEIHVAAARISKNETKALQCTRRAPGRCPLGSWAALQAAVSTPNSGHPGIATTWSPLGSALDWPSHLRADRRAL